MSYLPPYFSGLSGIKNVTVNLDPGGFATKDDLKSITHVDASSFALKINLSSLKTEVDKLDIPKLSTVPADLAKLTKEVQEDFTKKTDFTALEKKLTDNKTSNDNLETTVQNNHLTTESSINNLKTKVNGIELTKYVKKSDYDTKVGNLELKIPDISGLLSTNTFNSKVIEIEKKIKTAESKPDISNLASKTELKNVENKIPDTSGYVKLKDYSSEITKIKNDYATKATLDSKINN